MIILEVTYHGYGGKMQSMQGAAPQNSDRGGGGNCSKSTPCHPEDSERVHLTYAPKTDSRDLRVKEAMSRDFKSFFSD